MNKPMVVVTAPVATRSGYGSHGRDICRSLISMDRKHWVWSGTH